MWAGGKDIWIVFEQFAHHLYLLALHLGGPGLFFTALADSSFLSLPEANDYLVMLLSAGQPWHRMCLLVGMTVLGSVTGCALLYIAGKKGRTFVKSRVDRRKLEWAGRKYAKWGAWALLIPSLLPPPAPFKIFVLSAGVFRLRFQRFLLVVSIARSIRYFTWGILAMLYGEWLERCLKAHRGTTGLVLIMLVLAGIAGFALYRFFTRKRTEEDRNA